MIVEGLVLLGIAASLLAPAAKSVAVGKAAEKVVDRMVSTTKFRLEDGTVLQVELCDLGTEEIAFLSLGDHEVVVTKSEKDFSDLVMLTQLYAHLGAPVPPEVGAQLAKIWQSRLKEISCSPSRRTKRL